MKSSNVPLVSIICDTYNQQDYIKTTLDGFILQKTNFPIEIIVHDDCSTDNTVSILKEYEQKYPDLFCNIYEKENQYTKEGVGIWPDIDFPKARGKYIAFCEGDDYWIDPYKLQKQVDFLENNSEYGMVHTDFATCNKKGRIINSSINKKKTIAEGDVRNKLIVENFVTTLTTCARRELILEGAKLLKYGYLQADYPLWIFISNKSKIGYINEVTSVYRILKGSISHAKSLTNRFEFNESKFNVIRDFLNHFEYSDEIVNKINKNYASLLLRYSIYLNSNNLLERRNRLIDTANIQVSKLQLCLTYFVKVKFFRTILFYLNKFKYFLFSRSV